MKNKYRVFLVNLDQYQIEMVLNQQELEGYEYQDMQIIGTLVLLVMKRVDNENS